MAQQDPAWLNFLTGATNRRSQPSDDPLLNFSLSSGMSGSRSSQQPLTLPVQGIATSSEDARLQQNPDLEKQVARLRRDETTAAIVGAETERPKGLLGIFKNAAIETISSPVARAVFQAMSVIGAGGKQAFNALDTATESEYNPLNWLADRMDEFSYGKVRTKEEREQSIETRLQKIPYASEYGRFGTESLGLQVGEYGRPSLQEFKQDVANIRGGGELIPEFRLTEDAGVLEKAWKLPAAFLYDVRSAGGPRGFVRFGSNNLSRKQVGEVLGNQADDTFRKFATKAADETDDAFKDRATLFATKVTAGNLNSRSRGVREAFIEEFGEKVGREAFDALPKDLRGGLGVGFFDARVGNLNAGGYAVDAVAKALKMDPKLLGTKWNPIVGYQALKNNARVANVGRFLNNIGIESPSWANYVRAVAKNASDNDLVQAYKEYMTPAARNPAGRIAEILSEELIPAKSWLADTAQIARTQPELFKRTNDIIVDPALLAGKGELDELDRMALYYATRYRELFDNVHGRFIDEGLPVEYLNNFHPVIFNVKSMKEDGIEFTDIFTDEVAAKLGYQIGKKTEVTKSGLVNVPGKGYDPTKDRNIFMKEITDTDGTVKYRSASLKEMQDELRDAGVDEKYIKYLKTDPAEVLADYTQRAGKVIARKKLVNELQRAGLLFRGVTPRLTGQYNLVQGIIDQMTPDQLERLTKDFMRDPERFDQYLATVNDKLARAYDSADPQAIRAADLEVKSTLDALERLGDVYVERVMTPKALANYRRLVDAYDEAVDMGDTQAADKLRTRVNQAKRDAMKLREEGARTRAATFEDNVDRKAFDDYIKSALGLKTTSTSEIKRRYDLSNISALTGKNIKDTAYIPDELMGTIASENLNKHLGKWLEWNTRYALDDETAFDWRATLNAATQGFRTGATFGGGPGFVSRNGVGATFNNILVADVNASDYINTQRMWWTRITTDFALGPLETLTGKEAEDYLQDLITNGKLNPDAAALAKADIISGAKVSSDTIAKIRKTAVTDRLSKYKVDGYDHTLADAYEAAVLGGVYDPYQSVAQYSGLKREQNLASMLDSDTDWISIRNDRKPIRAEIQKVIIPGTNIKVSIKKPTMSIKKTEEDPRSIFQKATEAGLNAGVDIKAKGRTFNLRPVQLVRDMNQNMEEYHRNAAILAGLRKYGASENGQKNAVTNMRLAQFDYSNLTEGERTIGRALLPFYTWTRYNIPLQFRMLVNQPGTFNTVLDGWDTIQGIFGDENGDMYFMPEYAQEAFAFMINPELQEKLGPLMSVLGADPQNPIAVRLESPILDLNKYFTQEGPVPGLPGVDFEEFESGMNPFIKAFIQFEAEKNLYTGRSYSAEGVEAPAWYQAISTLIAPIVPSAEPLWDAEDQVYKVNEKWLDVFKTVLPTGTTTDRTTLPAIEAALESVGINVNLSNEDEKLFTSILSKGLGAPVTTVTPQTEAGEVASRYRYAEDQILTTSRRQKISEDRVAEYVRNAEKSGMAEADIIRRGRALAESGFFS